MVIADGAMGTILYSHGVDRSFDALNMTHPEQIQHIHEAYIHAGSEVIQTNTYGANYIKLARYGLEEQVKQINQSAVRIAKRASKGKSYIIGNIGGIHGGKNHVESPEEIKRSFREQLYCLLLEGVDGLVLETYYDFTELQMVLAIAREETDLPIITNVSMHEPGILENGMRLQEALKVLDSSGADVVGVNCRLGPAQMIASLESVALPNTAYLAAYPNASLPAYRDGVLFYENEPDYFKACAKDFRDQGVRLIGGCCGTTPEHIRAISEGLKGLAPLQRKDVKQIEEIKVLKERTPTETSIAELAKERPTIIVELDAPKHLDTNEYFKGAEALQAAGIDAITLADNSLATPRISNVAIAVKLQQMGIKPLVHLTCRDRNLIGLQAHLMGLHTLGITEILAITGDPTKIGNFPGATSVFDVNSFKLIELIKKGNQGVSFSGQSLREKMSFSVAAAFNPNVANMERAVQRLDKKLAHGADYILTQPIYEKSVFRTLSEATKHLNVPIFVGIMPLTSSRNAEFLHNEVPGIKLPDDVRARMKQVSDDAAASIEESIQITKQLIDEALVYFNGVYLITPFLRYDMMIELVHYIHERTKQKAFKQLV